MYGVVKLFWYESPDYKWSCFAKNAKGVNRDHLEPEWIERNVQSESSQEYAGWT